MTHKECLACGTQFEGRNNKRYCSKGCSKRKIWKSTLVDIKCKFSNCTHYFTPLRTNQIYCSSNCRTLDWCKHNRIIIPKEVFEGTREQVVDKLLKFFDDSDLLPEKED